MGLPERARMVVRNNPWELLKNLDRTSRGRKMPLNEIVVDVIKSIPPPPLSLKSAIPEEVGAFIPENKPIKNTKKPFLYKKPFQIEYPEDALRSKFYENHPFELKRPLCLVETEESLKPRDWTDIEGGDIVGQINSKKVSLSGENVIKRAMYLMSKQGGGLNREVAYRQAVSEFYEKAAEEEEKAEKMKKAAIDSFNENVKNEEDKISYRPFTDRIIQEEEEALQASRAHEQELRKLRMNNSNTDWQQLQSSRASK